MQKETSFVLYSENEKAWNSMLTDCAQAIHSIDLEQFIFVTDDLGKKLIDICAERASKGVKVRFLWDAAGSFTLWGSDIRGELRDKGIELIYWRTLIPGYYSVPNFRSWYLRNHRRSLIIDKKVGYTGSICIQDNLKSWRDTNVRLEGNIVRQMSNSFERMWERAIKDKVKTPRIENKYDEFRYVTNFPAPGRRHLYKELVEAIRNAKSHIYITTPYFVPTRRLYRVIKLAAHRKVDVKIILPEKTDHFAVDLGARSYFTSLLESGVRIFLYQGNMIHSKSVIIDGDWSTVGSLNLDQISLLYNFEANIISTNGSFAHELENHFINDLKNTREINIGDWKSRFFLEKMPEILIKLVRRFL
jgi:cardiolipin synthase